MKALLPKHLRALIVIAVVVCAIVGVSTSAMAGSKGSVQRTSFQGETHTGLCCTSWDASVTMTEPDKLVPIVVTWSTDYQANAPFFAALRVNGGPCTFYGPAYMPRFSSEEQTYSSRTFQWVIMPGDYKLTTGQNTIQLCGGGIFSATDTITLGFGTLTAQLQK